MAITVFVGLGGFGSSIVQDLYKKSKKKYGGDPPAHLQFVSYDSAMHEKPGRREFPNAADFMGVSPETAQDYLNLKRNELSDIEKWWPGIYADKSEEKRWYMSDLKFTGKGLGQFRPFGRLGFLYHLDRYGDSGHIIQIIDNAFSRANNLIEQKKNVYDSIGKRIILINSLAGGTGSSSFIDIAHLLKTLKIRDTSNFETILFTVTGDASMHGRAGIESPSYKWALANSFAALSELDYWLAEDTTRNTDMEYPRLGRVEQKVPLFSQVNIYCLENQNGKNLSDWMSYLHYISNLLYTLEIESDTGAEFNSLYDNILKRAIGKESRFSNIGSGSVHYPFKDALEYVFSFLVDDLIQEIALNENDEQAKKDLKDKRELYLEEEPYYFSETKQVNYSREDQLFALLEESYKDELMQTHSHPIISLSLLDRKLNHENLQMVIQQIEGYKKKIEFHYSATKQKAYNTILEAIKSKLLYKDHSISYIETYVSGLRELIHSRIKGLEKQIPVQFDEKEYLTARKQYATKKEQLERKLRKKFMPEFRSAVVQLQNALQLLLKSKAKLEIYQNLEKQLSWYQKAIDEVKAPLRDTVLRHYGSIRNGFEQDTYSNYEKQDFDIQVLPVPKYQDEYRQMYEVFKEEKPELLTRYEQDLLNELLHILGGESKDTQRVIDKNLWKQYQTAPSWIGASKTKTERMGYLDIDDQVRLKDYLKKWFVRLMDEAFRENTKEYLPQDVMEGLYKEWKLDTRGESDVERERFSEMITAKLSLVKTAISPFIVLKGSYDEDKDDMLFVGNHSVLLLFEKYSQDEELIRDKDTIFDLLKVDKQKNTRSQSNKLSERIHLIKTFDNFGLENVAAYVNTFRHAYEKLDKLECFTDIRLKPGQNTQEVLFLLAEYYGIIESNGAIMKFRGDTLEKGVRGRENNINWFLEARNSDKISLIKRRLGDKWKEISPGKRESEFDNLLKFLDNERSKSTSDSIRELYDSHRKTVENAIQTRLFENIDNFMA